MLSYGEKCSGQPAGTAPGLLPSASNPSLVPYDVPKSGFWLLNREVIPIGKMSKIVRRRKC